jgi:hypothetical protein
LRLVERGVHAQPDLVQPRRTNVELVPSTIEHVTRCAPRDGRPGEQCDGGKQE